MTAATEMTRQIRFGEAIREALDEAMAEDPSVFVLGEDIADDQGGGVFKLTDGLSTKYGIERVRTTPISEQAIIGAATGAAIAGMRPVAEIMLMNFIQVCMDQLVNHAAKLRFMSGGQTSVPLTVHCATGAGVGTGGQHSDMLESWLAHSAGMKVVVPSTPADAKGLMLSCIFDDDPCVFVHGTYLHGQGAGPAPAPGARVPIGKAAIRRQGGDITLVSYGRMMLELEAAAAELLANDGVDVETIDLRTIAPLDDDTVLRSVAKTRRVVIVHEAVKPFGVGAELSARINEELFGDLAAPVQRLGAHFAPVPFAPSLEAAYLPTAEQIVSAAKSALK